MLEHPIVTIVFANDNQNLWDKILDLSIDHYHICIDRHCAHERRGEQVVINSIETHMTLKHRKLLASGCNWRLYKNSCLVQCGVTNNGISVLNVAFCDYATYRIEILNKPIPYKKLIDCHTEAVPFASLES